MNGLFRVSLWGSGLGFGFLGGKVGSFLACRGCRSGSSVIIAIEGTESRKLRKIFEQKILILDRSPHRDGSLTFHEC